MLKHFFHVTSSRPNIVVAVPYNDISLCFVGITSKFVQSPTNNIFAKGPLQLDTSSSSRLSNQSPSTILKCTK